MSQLGPEIFPQQDTEPEAVLTDPPKSSSSRAISSKSSKKWRFFRRCARIPNCFLGIKIDLAIYIAIIFSLIVDSTLIGLWSAYRHAWVLPDDLVFQSEVTRLNGELIAMQVFCFISNLCLLLGLRLRFPLLCLSWVTIRLIWFYYALIAWMRAINLNALFKNGTDQDIRFNARGELRPLNNSVSTIWNISRIVIYSYFPLAVIFFWIIMGTTVFIFQIMEANEHRRRSTPVSVYIHPEQLRKLSTVG